MNLCQPRVSGTVHLLLNIHQSSVLETLGLSEDVGYEVGWFTRTSQRLMEWVLKSPGSGIL